MKRMIASTIFVLWLMLAANDYRATWAKTSGEPTATPTLEQILDKYVHALGGQAAFEKLISRVTVQDLTGSGEDMKVEIYEKAPNKRLIVTTSAASGQSLNGFDGTVGWTKNLSGLQEMPDAERTIFQQNAEFYREIKLRELYPQMTLKGKATVEGRAAYLIEAPAGNDRVEKLYFDAKSGLLLRRVQQMVAFIRQSDTEAPQMKFVDIENDYGDYRTVDGVKLPFTIKRRLPMFTTTIKVKEVKHNVALDDAKFKKPAS